MAQSETVHIRIDAQLKQQAGAVLASMGLTMSDLFRALLTQVAVEERVPFTIRVPKPPKRVA